MAVISQSEFQKRLARRKLQGHIFHALCLIAILIGLLMLAALLYQVISQGWSRVDWAFLTSFPSRKPERAGIQAALMGTIYVVSLAGIIAFVLGVGTAIFLEEYATRNWFAKIVQINIINLAGVPSIVYGILGLEIFVRTMGLGKSVLAGSFISLSRKGAVAKKMAEFELKSGVPRPTQGWSTAGQQELS